MNYSVALIFCLFTSCNKNVSSDIDFCEISNSIYLEIRKEVPKYRKPLIFDEIQIIDDKIIKEYLLTNASKFPSFNFNAYFEEVNTNIIYDLKCKTVSTDDFKKNIGNIQSKDDFHNQYKLNYGDDNLIRFYKPIFSKDKNECIIFYENFEYMLGGSNRLLLYDLKEDKVKLKEVLVIST